MRGQYNHQLWRIESKLNLLLLLQQREWEILMDALEGLTAQVAENTDAEQSAIAVMTTLSEQIALLKNDPVKLQALSDKLKASKEALAAAIVANTPAA
jgi:hypothetical protein